MSASTRPLDVSAPAGVMLDTVLSSLLGTSLTLGADDYELLATANLSVGDLLDELGVELLLGTPQAVLDANITLSQLLDAAAMVATDDGDLAVAAALSLAADDAVGVTATIQLGDLLELDLRDEVLELCAIGALDLLSSTASLFNAEHAIGRGWHEPGQRLTERCRDDGLWWQRWRWRR